VLTRDTNAIFSKTKQFRAMVWEVVCSLFKDPLLDP